MSGGCQKRENRWTSERKNGQARSRNYARKKNTPGLESLRVVLAGPHVSFLQVRPLSMASTITSKHQCGELSRENCRFCRRRHTRVFTKFVPAQARTRMRERRSSWVTHDILARTSSVRTVSVCRGAAGAKRGRRRETERGTESGSERTRVVRPRGKKDARRCAQRTREWRRHLLKLEKLIRVRARKRRRALKRAKEHATLDRTAAGCARSRNTDGRSAARCGANDERPSERAREREGQRTGGEDAETMRLARRTGRNCTGPYNDEARNFGIEIEWGGDKNCLRSK